MKKLLPLFGALLLLLSAAASSRAQDGGFQIIVHPGITETSVSARLVSRIFLRQESHWPDGTAAHPVDQAGSAAVREAFSRLVHGRSASSIASFWRQQIFSGRGVPPPEKPSDREVVAYVLSHRGGVGYVSASADIRSARVLQVR